MSTHDSIKDSVFERIALYNDAYASIGTIPKFFWILLIWVLISSPFDFLLIIWLTLVLLTIFIGIIIYKGLPDASEIYTRPCFSALARVLLRGKPISTECLNQPWPEWENAINDTVIEVDRHATLCVMTIRMLLQAQINF
jgi:hypothetical protein